MPVQKGFNHSTSNARVVKATDEAGGMAFPASGS